jgi:hypothetical protein
MSRLLKNKKICYYNIVCTSMHSWCEKMIGMDTSVSRNRATHKRLGILRKLIYSCNHEGRVPRWDDLLADVDRQYVTEYGIAQRQGRVFKLLKDWNL